MASLLKRAQEARARNKQSEQYNKDAEYAEARFDEPFTNERKEALRIAREDRELSRQEKAFRTTELQKQRIAEKKEAYDLKKQEREATHPIRTRAIRRAEKLTEKFLSQGEQVAQKAPKVAGRELRKAVRMQKPIRVRSGFQEGQPSGRNRLPVFAPSTGMGAGIAEETSRPPQPTLQFQQQQQQFFSSKPMELFSSGKQYDLGLGSNLVSGNGNKKKKEVRYY